MTGIRGATVAPIMIAAVVTGTITGLVTVVAPTAIDRPRPGPATDALPLRAGGLPRPDTALKI